jgi:hypothetical protein
MTLEEHLARQENEMNRLRDDRDQIQKKIHAITAPGKFDIQEVDCYLNRLKDIKNHLVICTGIRYTLMDIIKKTV